MKSFKTSKQVRSPCAVGGPVVAWTRPTEAIAVETLVTITLICPEEITRTASKSFDRLEAFCNGVPLTIVSIGQADEFSFIITVLEPLSVTAIQIIVPIAWEVMRVVGGGYICNGTYVFEVVT